MNNIDENEINNMPVGLHGKFRVVVDGAKCTWFIQSLLEATRNMPVVDYPVKDLEQHLELNAWFHQNVEPTPKAIVEHWRRMESADLNHAIILSDDHGIMDGLHRLMKAYYLQKETIKVVVLSKTPAPDHIER